MRAVPLDGQARCAAINPSRQGSLYNAEHIADQLGVHSTPNTISFWKDEKRFSRNVSVVPGERVQDDDGHAAVVPAGGLGLVVAFHGDVVVEGARRQPHQPATKIGSDPAEVSGGCC